MIKAEGTAIFSTLESHGGNALKGSSARLPASLLVSSPRLIS